MTTGNALIENGKSLMPQRPKRARRQMRFLAQAALLEEAGTDTLVRVGTLVICGVVGMFLVWASVSEIEETSSAFGQVVPAGAVQVVQHLEGGIIDAILVEEGQMVERGQVLVRFQKTQAGAELEQIRAREEALRLKAERLRAVGEGRTLDFAVGEGMDPDLVADQRTIYQTQMRALESDLRVLERQREQRVQEIAQTEAVLKATTEQRDIVAEEVAMREELMEKGLVSRVVYLNTKREFSRIEGEKAQQSRRLQVARERLAEVKQRINSLEQTTRQEALREMGEVTAELAQVREAMTKLRDRVERLDVRAPLSGLVQNLRVRTVGAVVPAGGIIMEVVPADDQLLVEARITTRDIGHITVDQPATVKITTYDFTRYGTIPGRVKAISPATYIDDEGKPYYKAQIELARQHVGEQAGVYRVLPGMTVQADITTGSKTLLQYLLKPIHRSFDQSFHER